MLKVKGQTLERSLYVENFIELFPTDLSLTEFVYDISYLTIARSILIEVKNNKKHVCIGQLLMKNSLKS